MRNWGGWLTNQRQINGRPSPSTGSRSSSRTQPPTPSCAKERPSWHCASPRPRRPFLVASFVTTANLGARPLRDQVERLAHAARINLDSTVREPPAQPLSAAQRLGLTARERDVLKHLTQGHTNTQIGAALYISPKTAGVHVTNILRKLHVTNRTQAAAVAERASLLDHTG